MAVTRDDVRNAYRFILGREPESDRVIDVHTGYGDISQLRDAVIESQEFEVSYGHKKKRDPREVFLQLPVTLGPLQMEADVDPETMSRLLRRVGGIWEELGRSKPHWSVLTHPDYEPQRVANHPLRTWAEVGADISKIVSA